MKARRAWLLAALAWTGCGDTGLDRVSFPVHAAGVDVSTFESDGWQVRIERADVGFGPVYFCATSFADLDVCPRAEAEWLGSATIDAIDPAPRMLGEADALTTTVRSAMFDYGVSWYLPAPRPMATEGAPSGHSARFVVRATSGDRSIEVRANVDVLPADSGQSAVIGARTGEHEITGDEVLIVRFDPIAWWRRVDFARVADLDVDGDGIVELVPGQNDYEALAIAMTAGRLPVFEWTF